MKAFRSFLVVYVAAFASIFTITMAAFYMPAVRAMGSDLHAKRSMLLLLPAPVVTKVPSLRGLATGEFIHSLPASTN